MKADRYFKVFASKSHSFYPLFENNAGNLVKASCLLKELMTSEEIEKAVHYLKNASSCKKIIQAAFNKVKDIEH
jgi:hypothetical protein